ncbi:hypothetical protein [Pilimelia columellifera]|uniref:Serine hydrolase n=1 Tax=Pilimelia columellifera subsp. columellifera TaxID=706583 RepID=A0ABP6AR46_9ACTN
MRTGPQLLAALILSGSLVAPAPTAAAGTGAVPGPTLRAGPVRLPIRGFASWAFLDRRTGQVVGSPNRAAVSSTESMIKVWIIADYLRRRARGNWLTPVQRRDTSRAIIWSDDNAAERLYRAGGRDKVIQRLVITCRLTDTYVGYRGWWSRTQMSARDAVRMGDCIQRGWAAGPRWTPYLIDRMRRVQGSMATYRPWRTWGGGRWGIITGVPRAVVPRTGIKNGWTQIGNDPVRGPYRDRHWHVNCLAVHPDWSVAVLLRYPSRYALSYGARRCALVARQLSRPA